MECVVNGCNETAEHAFDVSFSPMRVTYAACFRHHAAIMRGEFFAQGTDPARGLAGVVATPRRDS